MEPRSKLWLESPEHGLSMSDYRVELLRAIRETGSLAAAAGRMSLSYRRAWGKVRDLETNLGYRLVESAAGGRRGGGSHLTAEGEALVEEYGAFANEVREAIAAAYRRHFTPAGQPRRPARRAAGPTDPS